MSQTMLCCHYPFVGLLFGAETQWGSLKDLRLAHSHIHPTMPGATDSLSDFCHRKVERASNDIKIVYGARNPLSRTWHCLQQKLLPSFIFSLRVGLRQARRRCVGSLVGIPGNRQRLLGRGDEVWKAAFVAYTGTEPNDADRLPDVSNEMYRSSPYGVGIRVSIASLDYQQQQ